MRTYLHMCVLYMYERTNQKYMPAYTAALVHAAAHVYTTTAVSTTAPVHTTVPACTTALAPTATPDYSKTTAAVARLLAQVARTLPMQRCYVSLGTAIVPLGT